MSRMRLLPWPRDDGKPCYLSTDDPGSPMSQLADNFEAMLLETGEDLLGHVDLLMKEGPSEIELAHTVRLLYEALNDTLRVARSRGDRLPVANEISDEASATENREVIH